MDIEKALDILRRLRIATVTANVDGKRVYKPLTIAIDALEKEIPLKPLVDDEYGYFVCGNCKGGVTAIGDYEDHQYCLKCGQRLDWEK